MKKLSVFIAAALIALLFINAPLTQAGFDSFTLSGDYTAGQFRDVKGSEWYAQYVGLAYDYGFFKGKTADTFDPNGSLTLGESVKLAARLMSIYQTGKADFVESTPFYSVYADYALKNGIIDSQGDYDAPITRAEFAELMRNALPADAFPAIGAVPDYAISDVTPDMSFGPAVYTLYRAGVLAGSDRYGTFFPDSSLTRAEACAIMVRLAVPSARLITTLPIRLPPELIFQRSADAVFMLETFDETGGSIRTGSGFFISAGGLAVTNLHVLAGAASAKLTMYNGDVYQVLGVCAKSEENNLAMILIDPGERRVHFLNLADSDSIEVGNTVFALGSPLALINTMTEGIISNLNRELDGSKLFQFSAPISFGSGGSPVLNELGQVVGVASSSFSYGQNLNLAVPANFVKLLKPGQCVPLETLLQEQPT